MEGLAFKAYLFRNQGGSFTQIGTGTAATGAGTLQMQVIGNSLELLLNGQILAVAADATFASGATGVWGSPGATLDDFRGGPIPLNAVNLPFVDDFSQPDGSTLSLSWTPQLGSFSVRSGRLQGTAAGSLATVNQLAAAGNVGVQADITLTGSQYAGVVARYAGTGNYYLGQVVGGSGGFTAYLFKFVNGAATQLGTPAKVSGGSGTLRLEAVGNSIKLFFGGQLAVHAFDSSLSSGMTGIWASSGATVDNFSATTISTSTVSLPFADSFPGPDGSQLSHSWTEQLGNFSTKNNHLMANDPGVNLATVNLAPLAADVAVQASIALGTSAAPYVGLTARYAGTGDGNMYLGQVALTNGKYTASILRHVGGTWTLFSSKALTTGTGQLYFFVKGKHLTLVLNGQVVGDVTDTAITGAGLAGLRAGGGALYSNFSASAL